MRKIPKIFQKIRSFQRLKFWNYKTRNKIKFNSINIPIEGDEHHAEKGRRDVAIKEKGEKSAESISKDPGFVDVAWGRQGQVEGEEEEVGAG